MRTRWDISALHSCEQSNIWRDSHRSINRHTMSEEITGPRRLLRMRKKKPFICLRMIACNYSFKFDKQYPGLTCFSFKFYVSRHRYLGKNFASCLHYLNKLISIMPGCCIGRLQITFHMIQGFIFYFVPFKMHRFSPQVQCHPF